MGSQAALLLFASLHAVHGQPARCDPANWIRMLGGPGATTTADVCATHCSEVAEDVSADFESGVDDFSGSSTTGSGVCIVSTEVRGRNIQLSHHADCVFICGALDTTINAGYENDKIYMFKAYRNTVRGDWGLDEIQIVGNGNTVNGGPNVGAVIGLAWEHITVKGDDNFVHGDDGVDHIHVVGNRNEVTGDSGNDRITADGDSNSIYGGEGMDDIDLIWGSAGNSVDGGPEGALVDIDFCGTLCGYFANTCINCG